MGTLRRESGHGDGVVGAPAVPAVPAVAAVAAVAAVRAVRRIVRALARAAGGLALAFPAAAALLSAATWTVSAARAAPIYACSVAGRPAYADRPCAPGAQTVHGPAASPRASATDAAGAAADVRAGTPASAARAAAGPETNARAAPRSASARKSTRRDRPRGANGLPAPDGARCRGLHRSLERLDSRMRAGYTAAQGETLRERRRELRTALRVARCR